MNATRPAAVGYLRLSDMRVEDQLEGREAKLRAKADEIGWQLTGVITENDIEIIDGSPKPKPASAWKRRKVTLPSGHTALRVVRPKFRGELLPAVMSGINVIVEYGDRICRDHRDGEDFLEAAEIGKASMRSLDGQLVLTDGGTDSERDKFRDELKFAAREGRAKSERATNGRERWAGKSYQGGRRPFGYRVAEGTVMYRRNLVIDDAEAAIIRDCASAVLDHGISLKSLARDLRQQGVRTVTGKPFDPERLRETLIKPTLAGLQKYKTELRPAPWEAILARQSWEALVEKLTDEKRRTNGSHANAPRWLLSCFATCGVCGAHLKVSGKEINRYYVCARDGCVRRRAVDSDEFIAGLVIARLSEPDADDLLRPPPRKDADVSGLKKAAKRQAAKRAEAREMFAADEMSREDLGAILKSVKTKMAVIDAQIAASETAPDPLEEFRDKPAATVWASLGIARQRQVVQLLLTVTFLPQPPRAPFDARSIAVERRH